MSLWRQLTRGLRVIANQPAADRDLADEMEHYLEEATAERMAKGLSPEEARRQARLELGNMTVVREQVRDYGWESVVGTSLADLSYGARMLRRSPGSAIVAAMTPGTGHRRQHGDLQRIESNSIRTASLSSCRPDHGDMGHLRARPIRRDIPHISRTVAAEPFARDDRCNETMATDHDRRG